MICIVNNFTVIYNIENLWMEMPGEKIYLYTGGLRTEAWVLSDCQMG